MATAERGRRRGRARSARRTALRALAALSLPALAAACGGGETARARGDRLWADSGYTAALAEYRLALRQGGTEEESLLRVAHAYGETGQFEAARDAYEQLLARAPEHTDQAVYDYLRLAHRALRRGDRYAMANAAEAALALRPRLPLAGLALPLARYYGEAGDIERSLEYYLRALAQVAPDSTAPLLYEIGMLNEELGRCEAAVGYFGAYRERAPRGQRASEARWHIGRCSFDLALDAHRAGRLAEAMAHLDAVIELGVPENIQDQAWFDRGEILFALGRFDEALDAYRRVLDLNPARAGQLVERAQRRIDQIRFGA